MCLERVSIHVPKEGVERGRTGCGMGEAESLRDPLLKASALHEGTIGRALDTLYDHGVTALYIDSEKSGPPCEMSVAGRPRR